MKKVLFACMAVLLITTACSLFTQNKEEKFVNPLFYKPLIPISSIARESYLTPHSLKFSNSSTYKKNDDHKEGWTTQSCVLLENKQEYIILKHGLFYTIKFTTTSKIVFIIFNQLY